MRIILADDQIEVRSALRLLLEQETGTFVVGEAGDAGALVQSIEKAAPDLVLLDWELPGLAGLTKQGCNLNQDNLSKVDALRSICPELKVMALSGRIEARTEAIAAQADAFVSKGDPPEALLDALHLLVNGDN